MPRAPAANDAVVFARIKIQAVAEIADRLEEVVHSRIRRATGTPGPRPACPLLEISQGHP
jgi:hypothetical protein